MQDSTFRTFAADYTNRTNRALSSFVSYVQAQLGCDEEDALLVYDYFRRYRLVKLDGVDGTWKVSNGALLDILPLSEALRLTKESSNPAVRS